MDRCRYRHASRRDCSVAGNRHDRRCFRPQNPLYEGLPTARLRAVIDRALMTDLQYDLRMP